MLASHRFTYPDKGVQTGIVGNLKRFDIPAISQPHAQVNVRRGNDAVADPIHVFPECYGLYLYGHVRIYLPAGKKLKAMAKFKRAAALVEENAQTYLEPIVQTK